MPGNSTILLDPATWDLLLDAEDNIARADAPYALAQDAASGVKTFQGECYWDTTIGVPYLTKVFGKRPSIALMKALFAAAAVAGCATGAVSAAKCLIRSFAGRSVGGQVQVTPASKGTTQLADFVTVNPQGVG
jgi:hypothetical protein